MVPPPPRRIWIFTITTRPPPTFTTLHTTTETEQRSDPFVAPSEAVYLSKDIAVVRPSIVFGKGMLDGVSDGVEEAGKRKPASEQAGNQPLILTFIPFSLPLILWSRKGQIQNPAVLSLWLWGFRAGHKLPISLFPTHLGTFPGQCQIDWLRSRCFSKTIRASTCIQVIITYRQPVAWKYSFPPMPIYCTMSAPRLNIGHSVKVLVPCFEEFFSIQQKPVREANEVPSRR